MDMILQIVAALGGWGAAFMTYRATRSKWMRENVRLQSQLEGMRERLASLEPELADTRARLKHQFEQARLSVEIEHALAEEVGSFGGGSPSTALSRARRKAQEALNNKILRDRHVTSRAALEGRLARFDLELSDHERSAVATEASTAA